METHPPPTYLDKPIYKEKSTMALDTRMTALAQAISASEVTEGPEGVLGEGLPCNCPVLTFFPRHVV